MFVCLLKLTKSLYRITLKLYNALVVHTGFYFERGRGINTVLLLNKLYSNISNICKLDILLVILEDAVTSYLTALNVPLCHSADFHIDIVQIQH